MIKPVNKILGWTLALALILACAPVAIAPVPTLDPNAISTFIAQTAAAAATQTAVAIPIVRATGTYAPTFTPEPTFTSVPLIIIPSPTTVPKTQYFRVRHDDQLAIYDYRSRTASEGWSVEKSGLQTPEVVPLSVGLKLALGTNRTTMSGIWENFIDALNDYNPRKLQYVKANDTALFNTAGFPQMESLTMGGNIITLDEIKSGWGRVHTMSYTNPGSFDGISYKTRPDLIQKFVVVGWNKSKRFTYWTNPPPPYGDLFWPLVSSREVWIPMEYLEAFPFLPKKVTANTAQDIKSKPDIKSDSIGSELSEGQSATITDYYPSGSVVWGRISGGGWILLFQYQKTGPKYLTSWSMVTLPPLPPAE
jgi:hypothetical protein